MKCKACLRDIPKKYYDKGICQGCGTTIPTKKSKVPPIKKVVEEDEFI